MKNVSLKPGQRIMGEIQKHLGYIGKKKNTGWQPKNMTEGKITCDLGKGNIIKVY